MCTKNKDEIKMDIFWKEGRFGNFGNIIQFATCQISHGLNISDITDTGHNESGHTEYRRSSSNWIGQLAFLLDY